MSAEETTNVTQTVTLLTVEPGGENGPGVYWSFDQDDNPEALFDGPYESEELAVAAAQAAIKAAYEAALKQFIGDIA